MLVMCSRSCNCPRGRGSQGINYVMDISVISGCPPRPGPCAPISSPSTRSPLVGKSETLGYRDCRVRLSTAARVRTQGGPLGVGEVSAFGVINR